MTFHTERYIGFGLLILLLAVVAPRVADWVRVNSQLPPGYGAEGDRQRAYHVPATADGRVHIDPIPRAVQKVMKSLSAGSEASWVRETAEDGVWVYELHVLKSGKWSVIRIAPDGNVISPVDRDQDPATGTGAPADG